MSKRVFESYAGAPKKKRGCNDQPLLAQNDFAENFTGFAQRTLNKLLTFVQSTLPVRSNNNSVVKSGIFGQPIEILHMIIGHLTLEEIFNFSLTSKTAKRVANGFYANLKYGWIDAMFQRLTTNRERVRNCHYLIMAIQPTAKKNKHSHYTKIIEWIDMIYHKCQNVPMPLLFEALIKSMGTYKSSKVIGPLFKRWMKKDIDLYIANFPVDIESPQELKDLEEHLLITFGRVLSDSLQLNTKTYLLTLLMRSLVNVSDVYKLLYLFCATRTDESIDYEYFLVTHPEGTGLDFGNIPAAFALLMNLWKFPIINQYSSRDIFIILEDLTTLPVIWSMQNFVHFLVINLDLCVLSTCIRCGEGFYADAASTFYYCIRASKSLEILYQLTTQVMEYLPSWGAQKFADEVIHKSLEVIATADPTNIDRISTLRRIHKRVTDCMEIGLRDSRKACRSKH